MKHTTVKLAARTVGFRIGLLGVVGLFWVLGGSACHRASSSLASHNPPTSTGAADPDPSRLDAGGGATEAASPVEPEPAPEDRDPAFSAFDSKLWKRCVTVPEPTTTADMLDSGTQLVRCTSRRLGAVLARLPVRHRGIRAPVSVTMAQLAFDVCFVADVLSNGNDEWWHGANFGHTMSLGCRGGVLIDLLYFYALRAKGDDAAFAEHLQLWKGDAETAAQLAAALRRVVPSLEATAPENLDLAGWSQLPHSYGDADWRRLVRALDFSDSKARDWSIAACKSWPALTQRLGGDEACHDALRAFVLSGEAPGKADEYWEKLARGGAPARESHDTAPPSKDPDYARYAGPVYRECERRRAIDDVSDHQLQACITAKTRKAIASAIALHAGVRPLARRWSAFQRRLCQTEDDAGYAVRPGNFSAIDRWQCEVRTSLHGGFVITAFAHNDTDAFLRHMAYREAWGKKATKGIALLPSFASSPVCGDDDEVWPCRDSWVSQADLLRGTRSVPALQKQIHDLASELCATWSSLRARLGTPCEDRVANHLASYGLVLGALDSR